MGSLSSHVLEIRNVYFKPIPSRPLKVLKQVVCIGGNVYAEAYNGNVYTSGEMQRKMHLCGTGSDHNAIKALVALKIITPQQAYEHGESKRVSDKAYDMYRAAKTDIGVLNAMGIKFTKKQRAKFDALCKSICVDELPSWLQKEAKAFLEQATKGN